MVLNGEVSGMVANVVSVSEHFIVLDRARFENDGHIER